jgi:TonB family protein
VVTWHKALSKIMVDRHYQPTTFNLAFFMHTLFRDEIERETKEIEVEKTVSIPISQARGSDARAAAPAAPAPKPAAPTFGSSATPANEPAPAKAEGGSKNPLILGGVAAALALAGGLYWMFGRGPAPEPAPVTSEATTPATTTAPAGPSPEEIRAEIDRMLSERTAAMEKNLKTQYDQRLQELQKALADAQTQRAASGARPTPTIPTTTTPTTTTTTPPASEPSSASTSVPVTPAPAPVETSPAPEPAKPQPVETAPAPAKEPEPAPVTTAPRPQQVRVGDLVENGPGVVPPKLAGRIEPRYPPQARQLNKTATVTVRALVDENGRVERAEPSGAKAGYGFDEAALAAARAARFDPATKNGVRVKMWTALRITVQP